jgi:hypothetical protein
MAVNASQARTQFDTAAAVTLRDITTAGTAGSTAVTELGTGVSLAELDGAYWHNGEIPHGVFLIVANVTSIDQTTDETYVLNIVVDDISAMNNAPVTIAAYTLTNLGTGVYTFAIDSKIIPVLDPDTDLDDKFISYNVVLGGTSPEITFGMWIGRNVYA